MENLRFLAEQVYVLVIPKHKLAPQKWEEIPLVQHKKQLQMEDRKPIKKSGRPTKKKGEKRNYKVCVKLDTREYISLKAKANSAGISRSEYVRQSLAESIIRPRLTPELNN
jgi:predicted DNA binding CopG/RHH family protein